MNIVKRIAYAASTIVFSAASLLVYAPSTSANSYFGGNWKLVFYSQTAEDDENPNTDVDTQELFSINANGTGLEQVTSNDVPDANPQWSPSTSARRIAFDRYVDGDQLRDIYIQNINADGTPSGSAVALSGGASEEGSNEYDPSWNPTGDKIAYHSGVDDSVALFTINVSGTTGTGNNQVTDPDARGTAYETTNDIDTDEQRVSVRDTEPTWDRNGDWLTFTRTFYTYDLNGGDPDTLDSTERVVAIVPFDGDESDVIELSGTTSGGSPQWSPIANKIVYQHSGNIIERDLKSTISTPGDDTTSTLVDASYNVFAPTYSPDGKFVAASGGFGYAIYNYANGEEVVNVQADSLDLGENANGVHELDWARTAAPGNSVHECTIYVNETCKDGDFKPQIPDACVPNSGANLTKTPSNGAASYSNGNFTYKPKKDYVGEDQYVYRYTDENMNAITCTVNITVLPRAPDTGGAGSSKGFMIGSILAAGALSSAYVYKKKRFARR